MNENSTTECLYFRAFRSFLLQEPTFKMDFELLAHQYFRFPSTFKIFSQNEVQRLIQMQEAFRSGVFNVFKGIPLDFSNVSLPKMENVEQPHLDLIRAVYESGILEKYTGPMEEACLEYPVLYGNIDLMVISNQHAYAIEFKTDTATHAILGQVMKYYIGLCLKFNLKFFNNVQIITVCPGYDPIALKGLKQIGATTLLVDSKTLKVTEVP